MTGEQKKQLKKDIKQLLRSTSVSTNNLDFVKVNSEDPNFELIGRGCSSGVFRSKRFPFAAVKIYSPEHRKEAFLETVAYKRVKGIKFFPQLLMYSPDYLVIEYVEGKSLYDCLIEGCEIPDKAIEQVDEAIALAKKRGLKPSDVHFKNVVIHDGKITLIDLSDYLTAKHVSRWDRLKFLYKTLYKPFFKGMKIPKPLVDFFRKFFKAIEHWVNRGLKKK